MKHIIIFLILLLRISPVFGNELCGENCTFEKYFKANYKNLTQYLNISCERERIFDIIFNAYSIKFQALDFEYKKMCNELQILENNSDTTKKCLDEAKKYIKSLSEIAMDEYDSFLEDLNFELCGSEENENRFIKKHKRKYRHSLKKLIARNCK